MPCIQMSLAAIQDRWPRLWLARFGHFGHGKLRLVEGSLIYHGCPDPGYSYTENGTCQTRLRKVWIMRTQQVTGINKQIDKRKDIYIYIYIIQLVRAVQLVLSVIDPHYPLEQLKMKIDIQMDWQMCLCVGIYIYTYISRQIASDIKSLQLATRYV